MNHQTTREHHPHTNGAAKAEPAMKKDPVPFRDMGAPELLRRLEREIQEHPVRTLGLAAGIGLGVGALVVSTLGRRLLLAGGSFFSKELLLNSVKAFLAEPRA